MSDVKTPKTMGYFPAVLRALVKVFLSFLYMRVHHSNYFVNLLYYLDILGNALCGGNAYITVSARVGKYADIHRDSKTLAGVLWRFCERYIDYAFYPIDDRKHCWQSWQWALVTIVDHRGRPVDPQRGPRLLLPVLAFLVLNVCTIIAPLTRLAWLLRIIKKKPAFNAQAYLNELELYRN